jgi:dephospho-CoA kinase
MRAIPETHRAPDFGTEEWGKARRYNTEDGKTLTGVDSALSHLVTNARTLAAKELGVAPYKVARERKAVIVIGPPAAGKSTVANPMALELRAAIPDADEAKKIMPEYHAGLGSNATHEESALMAGAVLDHLMERGENLVIPKVGGKFSGIENTIKALKAKGYTVDVALMDVPPAEAFRRMIGRYINSGRLIPPHYFDSVSSAPAKVFEELKQKGSQDGIGKIQSDRGILPRVSESSFRNLGLKQGDEIHFAKPNDGPGGVGRQGGTGAAEAQPAKDLMSPQAADQYGAATRATKEIKETFGKPSVKSLLKRPGSTYPYDMADEAVAASLWQPGPKGAQAIRERMKAAGGAQEAKTAIEDAAVMSLRRAAAKDGALDPKKLAEWRAKHAEGLRAVPDLSDRIDTVAKVTKLMGESAKRRAAVVSAARKSAAAKLVGVSADADVSRIVGSMINGNGAVQTMRSLVAEARNNPAALDGLRNAVYDHLLDALVNNKGAFSADRFQTYIRRHEAALREVLDPEGMQRLNAIAEQLRKASVDYTAGKGSPTHEFFNREQEYGLSGRSIMSRIGHAMLTGVAALVGWHAGGGSIIHAMAGILGSEAAQAFRAAGMTRVKDVLKEAMRDPELMRALLMKAPQHPGAGSLRSLIKALLNVGLVSTGIAALQGQRQQE